MHNENTRDGLKNPDELYIVAVECLLSLCLTCLLFVLI